MRLFEIDPANSGLARDTAMALVELGRIKLQAGLTRDARSLAERAIGVLAPLLVSESGDRRNRRREAEAYLLAGATLAREGRAGEAKARWQQALSAVGPLAEGAREPLFLAALARTYLRLDHVDHAGPLLDRLNDMGLRMPELEELKKAKGV